MQQQTPDYLNTRQAAELCNLAPITLSAWRRQGRGPAFVKLGRAVRYARADVLAWLEANRRGTSASSAGATQ